ncbi:MAG: histone deacetylase family protein [Pseudomonadota bacterium]
MTTILYTHEVFSRHETPSGHPEQSARMTAVTNALAGPAFDGLVRRSAPTCSDEVLSSVHASDHVALVRRASAAAIERNELIGLDPDTTMGPASLEASLRAVGAVVDAVDAVFSDVADNAFVAARPPGHHAEPNRVMGFCMFNAAAIAAVHARHAHGASKVAVVDFDVHHGNGTQAAFWDDEHAFFASSHEYPQYPGTGLETDRGAADNIMNVHLQTGAGSLDFQRAWGERLLPALNDFAPELVIISAGFDAHVADPLGGLNLEDEDFAWATREIGSVAHSVCDGRIVSLLEGGYNLAALGSSVAAHVACLMASD